ncbi:MBL fold metallo-hydrolase [Bacillus sp. FJAT-44742]|uniref:MBL fold metallo-hydrolase n=1 Tax=Bacillus sp. FJAT-44742 TaxID=2014005 RepID=UPI000C232917|nr:MBL fold metallo-hydrolase [Bacillus sp. FJAT-44742]
MSATNTSSFVVHPVCVPTTSELRTINFYLLKKEKEIILFDAGLPGDKYWEALLQTLNNLGYSPADITTIILSHHHIDHCGLVNRLVTTYSIPVYAHPTAIPRLKRNEQVLWKRVAFFKELYDRFDCQKEGEKQIKHLTESIENNKDLAIQTDIKPLNLLQTDPFEIIHLPGHSSDQIGLWEQESGTLLGGDVLIEHISSNAFVEPDEMGKRQLSLLENIDTLRSLSSLPIKTVFSGHGSVISNPQPLIQKRLQRIEQKGKRILEVIESGAATGREIAQAYYKKTYETQFSLVMSEIIGQLDYLEHQGNIKKKLVDGVWHFNRC